MNLWGKLEGMWKQPVVDGMFWGMTKKTHSRKQDIRAGI
jgi:hypothetical protein